MWYLTHLPNTLMWYLTHLPNTLMWYLTHLLNTLMWYLTHLQLVSGLKVFCEKTVGLYPVTTAAMLYAGNHHWNQFRQPTMTPKLLNCYHATLPYSKLFPLQKCRFHYEINSMGDCDGATQWKRWWEFMSFLHHVTSFHVISIVSPQDLHPLLPHYFFSPLSSGTV